MGNNVLRGQDDMSEQIVISSKIYERELLKLIVRDTGANNIFEQSASLYEQQGFKYGDPTRKIVYYLDDNLSNPDFLKTTRSELDKLNCDLVFDTSVQDAKKRWYSNNTPRVDLVAADATVPMNLSDSSYLTEGQEISQVTGFLKGLMEWHPSFEGKVFIVTTPEVAEYISPEARAGINISLYTQDDAKKIEDPFARFVPLTSKIKELFPLIKNPFDKYQADAQKMPDLYSIVRREIIQTRGDTEAARSNFQRQSDRLLREISEFDDKHGFGVTTFLAKEHREQQERFHIVNRRIEAIKDRLQRYLVGRILLKEDTVGIREIMISSNGWNFKSRPQDRKMYEDAAVAIKAAQNEINIELAKCLLEYQQDAYLRTVDEVPGVKIFKSRSSKLSASSLSPNYYRAVKTLLGARNEFLNIEAGLGLLDSNHASLERREIEFFKQRVESAIKSAGINSRVTSKAVANSINRTN